MAHAQTAKQGGDGATDTSCQRLGAGRGDEENLFKGHKHSVISSEDLKYKQHGD